MASDDEVGHLFSLRIHITVSVVLLWLLTLTLPLVSAEEVSLEPGNLEIVARDASAGSTIRWEWQTTCTFAFSISRSPDTQRLLYTFEGSSDSSSLSVSEDGTYLLLWANVGNRSATLSYSITIEPGSQSVLLIFIVVFTLLGAMAFIYYLAKRRDRRRQVERPSSPRSPIMQSSASPPPVQTDLLGNRRPSSPAPASSDSVTGEQQMAAVRQVEGMTRCTRCFAQIPNDSRYCPFCLSTIP